MFCFEQALISQNNKNVGKKNITFKFKSISKRHSNSKIKKITKKFKYIFLYFF